MQKLRSILLASCASALCFVSGIFTPLALLPLLHVALIRGLRSAWLAAFCGLSLVLTLELLLGNGIAGKQSFHLVYYFSLSLLALLAVAGIKRADYPRFAMLATSLSTLCLLLWAVGLQWVSQGAFYNEWRFELTQFFQGLMQQQMQETTLGLEAERLLSFAPQAAEWTADLFPGLIYIYMAGVLALNVGLARRMPKLHRSLASVRNLAQFRNPDSLIWILLVAGFTFFANEYSAKLDWLQVLSMNILLGLMALYAAQGLAVWTSVLFFLRVRRFFRQVLFLVLVFSLQFTLPLLVGLGLVDVWWDWRSKMRAAFKNS